MGIFTPTKPGSETRIFTAAGLFLACTWITLSLRIWCRCAVVKSFGWDDGLLLLSAVTFTGFCAVVMAIQTVGGAEHIERLGIPALSNTVGMVVATFGLYIWTMIIFKISLGIFYLRFIIRTWQRYVVYIAVAINTLYGLVLFSVAIFQCGNPTQYFRNELKGLCMTNGPIYGVQLTGAIINATTDWALAVLPIFFLAKASMPRPAKITAGVMILLGCSGSIISLIRIQYIKELRPGVNFFRDITEIAIWSMAECGICISAATAAALRPLVRGLVERTGTSIKNTLNTLSLGSRLKILGGTSNSGRYSEALFGDWGTPITQYHTTYLESQEEIDVVLPSAVQKTAQDWSSGSGSREEAHANMAPYAQSFRGLSKMPLVREDVRKPSKHPHDQSWLRDASSPDERMFPQHVFLIDPRRNGAPDWSRGGAPDWPLRSDSMSPRTPMDRRF